jgi:hypothetical protein
MKKFIKDTRGSAPLWAAFIAIILCMLSVVAYSGAAIFSKYQTAQTELERTANISIDHSLINSNVRDLLLDIPTAGSIQALENNMVQVGYIKDSDGDWVRSEGSKTYYSLKDLQVTVSGELLNIAATVSMPLPWDVGGIAFVNLPIHVESKVLYIN